jgi:hypothetical protein
MLTAYLDESGHESPEHVVVAGFMGNDEQWRELIPLWRTGLGKRKGLHMHSLRWNTDRTKRLLERLGPIPHNCRLTPLLGTVRVSHYADIASGLILHKLAKGYLFAVWPIMFNAIRAIPAEETLELVFEEQHEYEGWVRMIFASFRGFTTPTGMPKLAGVRFIPKDRSVLTQPADYLAFGLLQGLRDGDRSSLKSRWCAPIFQPTAKPVGAHLTRHQVRTIASALRFYEEAVIAAGKSALAKGAAMDQLAELLDAKAKEIAAMFEKGRTHEN